MYLFVQTQTHTFLTKRKFTKKIGINNRVNLFFSYNIAPFRPITKDRRQLFLGNSLADNFERFGNFYDFKIIYKYIFSR